MEVSNKRKILSVFMAAILLSLCGCAGSAPLPGGTEDVNVKLYKSPDDLLVRVNTMRPGMTEQDVFRRLGRVPKDLTQMQRNDILTALYGSNAVEFRNGQIGNDVQSQFLQSLYGYSFHFKNVKKEIGFTSPWRLRTDESGYDYKVMFIFRNGLLYQPPIVTGGTIKQADSKTIFDFLNPASMIGAVR